MIALDAQDDVPGSDQLPDSAKKNHSSSPVFVVKQVLVSFLVVSLVLFYSLSLSLSLSLPVSNKRVLSSRLTRLINGNCYCVRVQLFLSPSTGPVEFVAGLVNRVLTEHTWLSDDVTGAERERERVSDKTKGRKKGRKEAKSQLNPFHYR